MLKTTKSAPLRASSSRCVFSSFRSVFATSRALVPHSYMSSSASPLMSCRIRARAQLLVQCDVLDDLGPPLIASPTHKRYPGSATPFHVFLPLRLRTSAEGYDTVHVSGNKRGDLRERVNRITIADVAREAGVSRQTVSRVLNDKDEIRASTR